LPTQGLIQYFLLFLFVGRIPVPAHFAADP
jgi:hypothetical protein